MTWSHVLLRATLHEPPKIPWTDDADMTSTDEVVGDRTCVDEVIKTIGKAIARATTMTPKMISHFLLLKGELGGWFRSGPG